MGEQYSRFSRYEERLGGGDASASESDPIEELGEARAEQETQEPKTVYFRDDSGTIVSGTKGGWSKEEKRWTVKMADGTEETISTVLLKPEYQEALKSAVEDLGEEAVENVVEEPDDAPTAVRDASSLREQLGVVEATTPGANPDTVPQPSLREQMGLAPKSVELGGQPSAFVPVAEKSAEQKDGLSETIKTAAEMLAKDSAAECLGVQQNLNREEELIKGLEGSFESLKNGAVEPTNRTYINVQLQAAETLVAGIEASMKDEESLYDLVKKGYETIDSAGKNSGQDDERIRGLLSVVDGMMTNSRAIVSVSHDYLDSAKGLVSDYKNAHGDRHGTEGDIPKLEQRIGNLTEALAYRQKRLDEIVQKLPVLESYGQ